MKAVIPVAGIGTHLRPHTHTQPKALVPVAGKPILAHIVDSLVSVNIRECIFIIGHLGEKIEAHIKENYPDLKCSFVFQSERLGIAHAIWTAREQLYDSKEIVIALGDTIFDMDLKKFINTPHSCLGTKKVDDPRNFGVVEIAADGNISKLVEKPVIPKSNIALVGVYKLKEVKEFMKAINYIIENNVQTRREFQLTDALMHMIDKGIYFKSFPVDNWFDCGKKEALLETNAILLNRPEFKTTQNKKQFENTIIIPPVNIAKNCKISNSIIGPNVSIGENANISYSIVRESIIGEFAKLKNAVLNYSIIGNDSTLKGAIQSLNLGDSTEIDYE